jgi:ATP-dependent Lon protease
MSKPYKLPLLPIRDPRLIIFPGVPALIDVGRAISLNAVNVAVSKDKRIIIAIQQDVAVENPKAKDFYGICTEAEIRTVVPLDNEGTKKRIIVVGITRAKLKTVGENVKEKFLYGELLPIEESKIEIDDEIKNNVTLLFAAVGQYFGHIPIKFEMPKNVIELSLLTDTITGQLQLDSKIKLAFLLENNPAKRLQQLIEVIEEVGPNFINSQDGAGAEEGGSNPDLARLQKAVSECGMTEEAKKVANQELNKLKSMSPMMADYQVSLNYVENLTSLPWNKKSEEKNDIDLARKCLDEDHHGLKKAKERILEFLAVRKLTDKNNGAILCFYGPPGTGKTSSGKSIARAMGREFVRMSVGGMHDEAEIRGHRKTYVGAMPGRIIQNIKRVGVNNPVYMLDEVDKMCKDFRGDPASALLEVLDPEQNNSFMDNYINVPFDLSNVFFIATVNDLGPIPAALRDRMEIIEIPGYSPHDKLKIAQGYLIPKQKEKNGLKDVNITISSGAINKIIDDYTSEAGVRSLERECGAVLRKAAVIVASGKTPPTIIKVDAIPKMIGPPKAFTEKAMEHPEVGLTAGLAWSQHGGSLLFVEGSLYPGKGDIKLTGNLGKVLQESANAAYTWIKSNHQQLGVDLEKMTKTDVHIHFPSGATPKDGPSAGAAIATCMVSLYTNRPVRNDLAMTGEITLRGRIIPIGGLVEKVMAAHRSGIKEVLFPVQNIYMLEEIPNDIKSGLILTSVSTLIDVLDKALLDPIEIIDNNNISTTKEEELINMSC